MNYSSVTVSLAGRETYQIPVMRKAGKKGGGGGGVMMHARHINYLFPLQFPILFSSSKPDFSLHERRGILRSWCKFSSIVFSTTSCTSVFYSALIKLIQIKVKFWHHTVGLLGDDLKITTSYTE